MTHTSLGYKLVDKGGQLIKIPRFYSSSKIRSCCGDEKPMPLNMRTYDRSFGSVLYRDINAHLNIRKEAIEKLKSNVDRRVQIKTSGEVAHSFTAYGVVSDASSNLENFLSTRVLEAESSLDSRLFTIIGLRKAMLNKPHVCDQNHNNVIKLVFNKDA